MKALVLALTLFVGNAFACSCEEWGSAEQILAEADSVFVGQYVSGTIVNGNQNYNRKTTMKIVKAFKPRPTRVAKLVVRSERGDGANCGTFFQRGGKYLILGYKDARGNTYTDGCSYQDVDADDAAMTALLAALDAASSSK